MDHTISHDHRTQPLAASDLPIDDQGRVYHLQIAPEDLAPDILLVGDPGRAEWIGDTLLRDLETTREHRGLVTITGTSDLTGQRATVIAPLRTTVTTSGMGTPSLEIVANELVALHEIDFSTGRPKAAFPRLHVIRVGTSGALQAATPLGTPVITTYAIGMDNTGLFYDAPYPDRACQRLEHELSTAVMDLMPPQSRFYGKIRPYVARAEPAVVTALTTAACSLDLPYKLGLTVSNSGFFAPQGRHISRLAPSAPHLDAFFARFDPDLDGQLVENMEMEASFLLHYFGGLGHWAGAVCPVIANRRLGTFAHNYSEAVAQAARVALHALASLRQDRPGS